MQKILIKFLGTGPAGKIPRPGCETPTCIDARKKNSKSRRLQTSTLIDFGRKNSILFDATKDIKEQWPLITTCADYHLRGIFLTHIHSDAAGGLKTLDRILEAKKLDPIKVYTEKQNIKILKNKYGQLQNLSLAYIKAGQKLKLNEKISITPIRVTHAKGFNTLGYIINAHQKKLFYASDFKKISDKYLELIADSSALIIDCSGFRKNMPWHQNLKEAMTLIKKLKPRKTYLTQIGIEWPPHDKATEILKSINKNLFIAHDNLIVSV